MRVLPPVASARMSTIEIALPTNGRIQRVTGATSPATLARLPAHSTGTLPGQAAITFRGPTLLAT